MATAVFPKDTAGIAIDAFARRPLWAMGLEYLHGTGHGVGAHMCVHEGALPCPRCCTEIVCRSHCHHVQSFGFDGTGATESEHGGEQ